MSEKSYYVTTPLYYVNAKLHIGGAYTTIIADVLARYYRLQGFETYFLTGSDEHGQKIANVAAEKGVEPKEFADTIVGYFQNLWKKLEITHDQFIRTTDVFHERVVKAFFKKLEVKGFVYKDVYKTLYCTGCEKPYMQNELTEDALCPIHKTKPDFIEEENYFFKLSEFTTPMIDYLTENPESLQPDSRRAEILGKLRKDGLQDVSVSRNRSKLTWGVSMPDDDTQVVWVWFDALINYVSALLKEEVDKNGEKPDPLDIDDLLQAPKFQKFWNNAVHLIGKDILWHHTVIWWPMLLGIGLKPPKTVWAHGWWSVEGQKISKSLGTAIDPTFISDYFGNDALRYYLLREMTFGNDGDFSIKQLVSRINNDLGKGGLGNFSHRTLNMIEKYRDGKVPAFEESVLTDADRKFAETLQNSLKKYQERIEQYKFHFALDELWNCINAANQYAEENKPWKLAKDESQNARLDVVLYYMTEALRLVACAFLPIIPDGATALLKKLQIEEISGKLAENLLWGKLKPGTPVVKGEPIYPVVSSALIIESKITGNTAHVGIKGFLDDSTHSELADIFSKLAKEGATSCEIDVEKVAYFSAPAIPAFKRALNKFEFVKLIKNNEDFTKVLKVKGYAVLSSGQLMK